MGCMVLFTEDHPDVSIPALEYAGFGSVPYKLDALAYHNTLKISQSASDVLLNVVAAILMQNHEIVVVIASCCSTA
jgi:hypothetical protein